MTEQIMIKIEKIMEYKKILDNMKEDCIDKFLKDPVYRGAVLHYLYLIADSCVSLAEMIILDKGLKESKKGQATFHGQSPLEAYF